MNNKIIFLGTGGGGSMVSLQKCATAGFWANIEGVDMYFDPGPSAIYKIRQAKLIPDDLKGIFITHKHLDHTSDLNALIEAVHYQVSRGGWNYRNYMLFVPRDVFNGSYILSGHKKMPGEVIKVQAQKKYKLKHLEVRTTKKLLEKPYYKNSMDQFGYQIKGKKYRFTYIPETFHEPGLFKGLKSEIVVLNAMKPTGDYYEQLVKTVKEISPKLVLLQHWVKRSLEHGVKKLAQKLERDTKVKILAMKDGDIFDLTSRKLRNNK